MIKTVYRNFISGHQTLVQPDAVQGERNKSTVKMTLVVMHGTTLSSS